MSTTAYERRMKSKLNNIKLFSSMRMALPRSCYIFQLCVYIILTFSRKMYGRAYRIDIVSRINVTLRMFDESLY